MCHEACINQKIDSNLRFFFFRICVFDALHLLKTPKNDFYGALAMFKHISGIFTFFRVFHAPGMAAFEKSMKNLQKKVENRQI